MGKVQLYGEQLIVEQNGRKFEPREFFFLAFYRCIWPLLFVSQDINLGGSFDTCEFSENHFKKKISSFYTYYSFPIRLYWGSRWPSTKLYWVVWFWNVKQKILKIHVVVYGKTNKSVIIWRTAKRRAKRTTIPGHMRVHSSPRYFTFDTLKSFRVIRFTSVFFQEIRFLRLLTVVILFQLNVFVTQVPRDSPYKR